MGNLSLALKRGEAALSESISPLLLGEGDKGEEVKRQ